MDGDRPGEFELIKRYFAPLANDPGSLGLADDAAVLKPSAGCDLVLTKDMLAADVHFFADDAPEAIAAKALRVNLSDLAAKGARPLGYLMGLALPKDWTATWLQRFSNGLSADQAAYDVQLLGGDTIRSANGLQVSITAIGEVPAGRAVRRAGARPGDAIFVSGTIGDAAAGLKARLAPAFSGEHGLTRQEEAHILDRYLLPRPRTGLAALLPEFATAAMDISDGLVADGAHLAGASGVDLRIDLSRIPLSSALKRIRARTPDEFIDCVNGGDDFEILACVPETDAETFSVKASSRDCPVTRIGTVEAGDGEIRIHDNGQPVSLAVRSGFRHF